MCGWAWAAARAWAWAWCQCQCRCRCRWCSSEPTRTAHGRGPPCSTVWGGVVAPGAGMCMGYTLHIQHCNQCRCRAAEQRAQPPAAHRPPNPAAQGPSWTPRPPDHTQPNPNPAPHWTQGANGERRPISPPLAPLISDRAAGQLETPYAIPIHTHSTQHTAHSSTQYCQYTARCADRRTSHRYRYRCRVPCCVCLCGLVW
jgi:hypothetical protein